MEGRDVDRRRRLVLSLRLVASAVMLTVLVQRVHLSSLLPEWNGHTFVWLAAGLGTTFVAIMLSALRWQRVLVAMGLPAPAGTLVSHYLAGLFVGNFLPSTIGGDVLRVSRLSASNGDTPATFASVVIERLTGWLVLPVIALVGLATNPSLFSLHRASIVVAVVSGLTLGLLLVVLWVAAHPNLGGRLAQHESWLRFLGAVHLGVDRCRRQPGAVAGMIAVSFTYQLAVVLAACLATEALGIDVGWGPMLAFVPVVAILQVAPVSVGGLGVREGAFFLFLHPLGVTAAQAVALGLLVYGMQLAVSLLGAPAFAIGGRPARVAV